MLVRVVDASKPEGEICIVVLYWYERVVTLLFQRTNPKYELFNKNKMNAL